MLIRMVLLSQLLFLQIFGACSVKSKAPEAPSAPITEPAFECPKHIDCMPPLPEGESCPDPELMKRCPNILVTH